MSTLIPNRNKLRISSSKFKKDVKVSNMKEQNDIFFLMGGNTKKKKRWSRKRIQKVKRAIQNNHESLTATDDYHRTPLLLGLLSNAPTDVLLAMIEANPDALLVKDRAVLGNTFLHEAVTRKGVDTSVLIASVHSCPKALSIAGSGGILPISTALQAGLVSPTFIVEAVRTYPKALEMVGFDGMTPFHHVMKGNWNSARHRKARERLNEIARVMIEIYPQGLAIQDREGQTPLHLGMRYGIMDSDVLEAAIDARPDVIAIKTYREQSTVLHTGMEFSAPDRAIIAAINASPDSLDIVNSRNDTPLWQAVKSSMAEGVLMAALDKNPKAAKGRLEISYHAFEQANILELAVQYSAPVSFLLSVIRKFPEFLVENETDPGYGRPPLLHRMIRLETHLDVLEEAIKTHPPILMKKDNIRGETPLCFAARVRPRKDLFKLLIRYGPDTLDIPDNMGLTPFDSIVDVDRMMHLLDAVKETKPLSISMIPKMDCSKRRFCAFFFNVVAKRVDKVMIQQGSTSCGIPMDVWWNIVGMLCEDDLAGMSKISYLRIMFKSGALFS